MNQKKTKSVTKIVKIDKKPTRADGKPLAKNWKKNPGEMFGDKAIRVKDPNAEPHPTISYRDKNGHFIKGMKQVGIIKRGKFKDDFFIAAKQVLAENEGVNVLACTKNQLFLLIKERMGRNGADVSEFDVKQVYEWFRQDHTALPDGFKEQFLELLAKMSIEVEKSLVNAILETEKGWQRFAWLLERRNKKFRLPSKNQVSVNNTIVNNMGEEEKRKEIEKLLSENPDLVGELEGVIDVESRKKE